MPSTIIQSIAAAAVLSSIASASVIPIGTGIAKRSEAFKVVPHGEYPASPQRRHHAKMAELSKRNLSPRALTTLTGFGTLYYDINGGGTCGPANGWSSFPETQGYAMCEPWTNPKTLAQRGTNRIVALPVSMMTGNLDKYCGKEVSATYNGRTIDGLIAWDGCAACDNGNGIDFSSTMFGELVGTNNCGAGKVQGVTWTVKDNSIWDRNGNPVAGSGSYASSSSASSPVDDYIPETSTTSSSEQWEETPVASTSEQVERSTSSSSSEWTEPSTSARRQQVQDQRQAISENDDGNSNNIASARLPILAVAQKTSSTAEKTEASKTEEAQPKATEEVVDDAATCNDQQGQWKCNGKNLEQCIQDGNNWIWSNRVECSVDPINCDTANPVCPGKATACTSRKLVKL